MSIPTHQNTTTDTPDEKVKITIATNRGNLWKNHEETEVAWQPQSVKPQTVKIQSKTEVKAAVTASKNAATTPVKRIKKTTPVMDTPVMDRSEVIAKRLGIRPATKAAVDLLLANPDMSQTKAWLATHGTTNPASARATASAVLSKPNIQLYKQSHIDKATRRIVELVDSNREDIALKASESILDRTYGKSVSKSISSSIDTVEQLLI